MGCRKLVERDGIGTVTLDKGDLALDGYVDENGTIEETAVVNRHTTVDFTV